MQQALSKYCLFLADNNLILSHKLSQLCGHGPSLEEDIALTNIALDLLGQSRFFYGLAGELLGKNEDQLVYFRDEREFYNLIMLELPHQDYADTMLVLNWYSIFYDLLLTQLMQSSNSQLKAIAEKASLEVCNHKTHSTRWLQIFNGGSDESRTRLEAAINKFLPYLEGIFQTGDFDQELIEQKITPSLIDLKQEFLSEIRKILPQIKNTEAVSIKSKSFMGQHSEYLGYLLADIQHLAQKHPGASW